MSFGEKQSITTQNSIECILCTGHGGKSWDAAFVFPTSQSWVSFKLVKSLPQFIPNLVQSRLYSGLCWGYASQYPAVTNSYTWLGIRSSPYHLCRYAARPLSGFQAHIKWKVWNQSRPLIIYDVTQDLFLLYLFIEGHAEGRSEMENVWRRFRRPKINKSHQPAACFNCQ